MAETESVERSGREDALDGQRERLRELLAQQDGGAPLGDAVYAALRQAIMTNLLPQSTRLSGVSLAGLLGVSRTPVRDALRRLESERLVVSSAGSGFVVVPLRIEDIDEIYTLRAALEGCAAALAARHRTSADLSLLEAVHQAFAAAVEGSDTEAIAHLNSRFHEAILAAAKSDRLTQFVVLLQQSVRRLGPTTLASRERARQSVDEHDALLAAIGEEDSGRAEMIARQHMEEARLERLKQYQRAFISLPGAGSSAGGGAGPVPRRPQA